MLLFYVDESGDPELQSPGASTRFILAAVGIAETSRGDLANAILEAKQKAFGPGQTAAEWGDTEIKGMYLWQAFRKVVMGREGRSLPAGYDGMTQKALLGLCSDLALLLKRFRPIVFAVAVDKTDLLARNKHPWNPVSVAYTFIQQRLALLLDRVYGDVEGALMICDEQQEHERLFRSGDVLRTRSQATSGLALQPDFRLLLEKPLWLNPERHPLDREILQLADICSYSVNKWLHFQKPPAAPCFLWEDWRRCFQTHWTTGAITDGGLAIYPRPGQYPDGL